MSELPTGWAWSTIGELSPHIQRGKSPKYADRSELPVINQKCIRWTRLETQHLKFIHPEQFDGWDAARRIQPGDVLWNSTGTGTVGRAYLVQEGDCTPAKVVDSHVTIVRPNAAIEPRYLFSWIRSAAVQDKILEMCDGTTNQIELSRTAIAETAVPVAPASEQTRIADQLDTLLARIQACQDRLEAIPALLKRFRELILDAAIDGSFDRTQDEPSRRTKRLSLADICLREKRAFGIGPFGSDLKVADYRSEGVPLVFVRDVRARRFGGENTRFVSAEKAAQLAAHTVQAGDLLITKMGDPPGDTAIYPMDRPTAVMTADVVRMRVDPLVADARYVSYWFESTTGRRLIASITAGVAQRKVSLERLKSLAIDLPDPGVQSDVALRVERLLAVASHLAERVGAAQKIASRLSSLTLSKAFRGELVPQDPNDEPAGALLARIAAQRNVPSGTASAPTPRRGRPPRAPKESATMTKSRQDDDVMGRPYLAGHLRRIGTPASAEALFKVAELPVADFYKQLAWEVDQGHVKDNQTTLEPGHAAG